LLSSALENHCFDLDQHIDHPTPQQLDVAHQQRAAAALRLHSLQIERFASETVHVPADLKPSIADARNTNEVLELCMLHSDWSVHCHIVCFLSNHIPARVPGMTVRVCLFSFTRAIAAIRRPTQVWC
jgi:hypothetical protein